MTERWRFIAQGFSADLARLGGASTPLPDAVSRALTTIGLLSASNQLVGFSDRTPWIRGGAETYIARFSLHVADSVGCSDVNLIAKAIVKWGAPPEVVAQDWQRREARLQAFGVPTAAILAVVSGVVVQPEIPLSLVEQVALSDPPRRQRIARRLAHVAAAIDLAGFAPVSLVPDLRLRHDDAPVVVDFGEDLGGFTDGRRAGNAPMQVRLWLADQGIPL